MSYVKTTWVDDATPISALNMNNIEQGVFDAGVVIGTYTGDGVASRTISLWFRPKAVFVLKDGNFVSLKSNGTIPGYIYGGFAIDGSPLLAGGTLVAMEVSSSGFIVRNTDADNYYYAYLNSNNASYKYFVFR